MNQILGIIPARYASTRFPGKPLAIIKDKPMIQWVMESVRPAFDHLYVATDDERIKKAVETAGGEAVMTSDRHSTGTERCMEAMQIISAKLKIKFSHVINIQGDEPFIKTDQINDLTSCFDHPGTDIATLASAINNEPDLGNPNVVKVVMDNSRRALYFSRAPIPFIRSAGTGSQTPDHRFYRHIGLYGYRAEVLDRITDLKPTPLEQAESLEQLRWLENGFQIRVAISEYISAGVDTPEDLERINMLLE